jgi:cysteine-rich repeat protein
MRPHHWISCAFLIASSGLLVTGCVGDSDESSISSAVTSGPDYVQTTVSDPPATATIGGTFAVTDTVQNSGNAAATAASSPKYLLSLDTVRNNGDVTLTGTHSVAALAVGASDSGGATLTIPNMAGGTYYLLVCADSTNAVAETNENNNCLASTGQLTITGPDLAVSMVSDPPATNVEGTPFAVTDTTQNVGTDAAGASVTRYYVSSDGIHPTPGTKILGSRNIGSLAGSATDSGGMNVSVPPGTPSGTYFLLACADKTNVVTETDETNNCLASTGQMAVTAPDLTESTVTATPTPIDSNAQLTVTETAVNSTMVDAADSITRFYISADNVKSNDDGAVRNCVDGGVTPGRDAGALAAGASSTGSTSFDLCVRDMTGLHRLTAGTYYVFACADDAQGVAETDETNNCAAAASTIQVTVCGNSVIEAGEGCDDGNAIGGDGCSATCQIETPADLIESAITDPPSSITVGGTFNVTETVTNQGQGPAGASQTSFYLSTDRTKSGADPVLAGARGVGPILGGGGTSTGTTAVTIPTAIASGAYYLIACADATNLVSEVDETNNCLASVNTVTIGGGDLTVTMVSNPPATAINGATFTMSDTTTNSGSVNVGASVTRYFMSSDGIRPTPGSTFIGQRSVSALAAGANDSGSATVQIPSIAAGTYFILACADKTNVVPEVNEGNNCAASGTTVVVSGPDLVEMVATLVTNMVASGQPIGVSDTVTNTTTTAAGASASRYYVSTDATFSSNDLLMRACTGNPTVVQRSVPGLAGGASNAGTTNVTLCYRDGSGTHPVAPGTYFMIVCADDTNKVFEVNETNNCTATTSFTVTP